MFDYNKIISDFQLDTQTSKDMIDAFQEYAQIFNMHEPWVNEDTASLHVAKTICEKVAEAVAIEYKSVCSDEYINKVYQKFLRNVRTNTEYMIGKSCIFFKPCYSNGKIKVTVIQADKFIPVKFDDTGDLLACITIDQLTKGEDVYTRLEYNELIEDKMVIKNIAYKGRKNGSILESKISLASVPEWKKIDEFGEIVGIDRLIGGFASTKSANTIDNSCPIGMPIYYNALDTLKKIDEQWTRTIWEYVGSELAIDIDESLLDRDRNGNVIYPKGKKRLFRKMVFDEVKDKNYNVFSPEIRDTSMFNGLNEMLRKAEVQCHLEHGTLSKTEAVEKSATEAKQLKQSYYITVKDIQLSMQQAFDDLLYGIYVLCKLNGIPVQPKYVVEHDWDDSILVDKDTTRNQALIERNNGITSDVQYIMDVKGYKEEEAIKYIQKQNEYKKLTEKKEESDIEEE